jgi:hypothetical protein
VLVAAVIVALVTRCCYMFSDFMRRGDRSGPVATSTEQR